MHSHQKFTIYFLVETPYFLYLKILDKQTKIRYNY